MKQNNNGWHISVKLEKIFEENDLNGFISLIPFFYEKYPFTKMVCRYDNNEQNKKWWTHASLPINNEKSWKDIHSYLLKVIEYCIEHENIQIPIFLLELFPSELEEIEQQLGDVFLAKKFIKEVREKYSKLKTI